MYMSVRQHEALFALPAGTRCILRLIPVPGSCEGGQRLCLAEGRDVAVERGAELAHRRGAGLHAFYGLPAVTYNHKFTCNPCLVI
eukprot:5270861-Karenia_brevis.AAC.1